VLFVSHNMAAVEGLCNRCLFISEGRLAADGKPHDLVTKYLAAEAVPENAERDLTCHPGRRGGLKPVMRRVSLRSQNGLQASSIRMGEGLSLRLDFESPQRTRPFLNVCIKNNYGVPILTASTRVQNQYQFSETVSAGNITCHLRDLPLLQGTYSIDLFLSEEYQNIDVIYDSISFEVIEADVFGTGQIPSPADGSIFWSAEFELNSVEAVASGR
jgi:lipopolysaccharide transport system ATP-binding protein